jgi:hypothetical protein
MSEVVEDNPSDLSKYGLDKPAKIEFTGTDGTQCTLLIGSENEDGARYIMKDGINSVMLSDSDFSFLDVSKIDIISSFTWIYNIDDVVKAEYNLDGEKHVLDIDSDSANKKFVVSLDGGEVSEDNARRLYQRSISIFIAGEIPEGTTWGSPKYTITFTFRSGGSRTMELCPINDRQYAVVFDSKAEFYVNVKDIENLVKGFEINAAGDEIPSV